MKTDPWERETKAVLIATIRLLTHYVWQNFIRRLDLNHEDAVRQYPPYWIDKAKYTMLKNKNRTAFNFGRNKVRMKWGTFENET